VSEELSFDVSEDEAGERVDVALAALAGVSRAQIRRWIDQGRVRVNGERCRAARAVGLGDRVDAEPPEPAPPIARPEAIALSVLFEDEYLLVLDKPAGMVVHPAPGHASGTLVNALLHHCGTLAEVGGVLRPGIVHRLDRGTSGVMVVAKSSEAHAGLAAQFHDHSIERVYRAFVRAIPTASSGRVDKPIGRHPRDRKRMSIASRAGREAHTAWRLCARYPASGASELEVRPETGRTHQIRVHLASDGLPILGDPVYGRTRAAGRNAAEASLERPALHAGVLGFTHPRTGKRLRFEALLPVDLARLEATLAAAESARGARR